MLCTISSLVHMGDNSVQPPGLLRQRSWVDNGLLMLCSVLSFLARAFAASLCRRSVGDVHRRRCLHELLCFGHMDGSDGSDGSDGAVAFNVKAALALCKAHDADAMVTSVLLGRGNRTLVRFRSADASRTSALLQLLRRDLPLSRVHTVVNHIDHEVELEVTIPSGNDDTVRAMQLAMQTPTATRLVAACATFAFGALVCKLLGMLF